jgi:triacylglycerol lipase
VLRGTELPVEWAEDMDALFAAHPLGGLVEHGFWSIYRSMTFQPLPLAPQPAVITAARGIIDMLHDSGASVTVIGHSLGAPLAAYLALDLAAALGSGNVGALLYACPKPGDGVFGHHFDTTVGHDNYAVFNYLRDVVPRLPLGLPFGLGFQALPNVNIIRPSTGKANIRDNIVCNHSALSYAALLGATVTPSNTCIQGLTP